MSFDPLIALQASAKSKTLSSIVLSSDGQTLTFPSSPPTSATTKYDITLPTSQKTVSYTLASVYLCIIDPVRSLIQYRKTCVQYGVKDLVKVTDKPGILAYFLGEEEKKEEDEDDGMEIDEEDEEEEEGHLRHEEEGEVEGGEVLEEGEEGEESEPKKPQEEKKRDHHHHHHRDKHHKRSKDRHRDKHHRDKHHRDHHHHKDKDKKRRSKEHSKHKKRDRSSGVGSSGHKPTKAPMTNEQLMQNLNIVVDKRTGIPSDKDKRKEDEEEEMVEGALEPEDTAAETKESSQEKTESPQKKSAAAAALSFKKTLTEEEERQVIQSCLSFKGFEVSNSVQMIEEDKKKYTDKIQSLEIPVGDSSSVLRAGAGGGKNNGNAAGGGNGAVTGQLIGGGIVTTGGSTGGLGSGGTGGGENGGSNGNKRDFARVLELYSDMLKTEEKLKRGGGSGSGMHGSSKRPPPPSGPPGSSSSSMDAKRRRGPSSSSAPSSSVPSSSSRPKPSGKPIIIVPNAMTSPLTILNSLDFFKNATFIPRDIAIKKGARKVPSITFKRRVASRLGGQELEYEIIDNPCTRLRSTSDWDRIVAVVAQGAEWQFKGWRFSKPVDVFGRSFGFYVGMDGAPMPKDVGRWNVKIGKLSRDRRGLDNVTYANFWNGLDQWMSVHKKEYFPTDET